MAEWVVTCKLYLETTRYRSPRLYLPKDWGFAKGDAVWVQLYFGDNRTAFAQPIGGVTKYTVKLHNARYPFIRLSQATEYLDASGNGGMLLTEYVTARVFTECPEGMDLKVDMPYEVVKYDPMDQKNREGEDMLESEIKKEIKALLDSRNVFWSMITGGPYSKPGDPDMVACCNGRYIAIEGKTPDGVQSDFQKRRQYQIETAGGIYILARSADDVRKVLDDLASGAYDNPWLGNGGKIDV